MNGVQTVVVKIGSSSLVCPDGSPQAGRADGLAAQLAELRRGGWSVVLVSSGAVATGRAALGWGTRQLSADEKRAAAAVGQGILARAYEEALSRRGLRFGQVLVTRTDIAGRAAYVAFGRTLEVMMSSGAIPVLNENDTLADPALAFEDNDALAAMVAGLLRAAWLILLTDTAGVFDADPKTNPGARPIAVLPEVDGRVLAATGAGREHRSPFGRGGMASKLRAADLARKVGTRVAIASADAPDAILEWVLRGSRPGTLILPVDRPGSARKHWIGSIAPSAGTVHVDGGAARAIATGRASLLLAGVTGVSGLFAAGEVVDLDCPETGLRARGVAGHDALALNALLAAAHSRGRDNPGPTRGSTRSVVIHRDDLVVLPAAPKEVTADG